MEKKQIIGTFTVAKAYAGLKNQGFSEAELRRIFKGLAKLRPDACTFYPPKGRRSARLVIHHRS